MGLVGWEPPGHQIVPLQDHVPINRLMRVLETTLESSRSVSVGPHTAGAWGTTTTTLLAASNRNHESPGLSSRNKESAESSESNVSEEEQAGPRHGMEEGAHSSGGAAPRGERFHVLVGVRGGANGSIRGGKGHGSRKGTGRELVGGRWSSAQACPLSLGGMRPVRSELGPGEAPRGASCRRTNQTERSRQTRAMGPSNGGLVVRLHVEGRPRFLRCWATILSCSRPHVAMPRPSPPGRSRLPECNLSS